MTTGDVAVAEPPSDGGSEEAGLSTGSRGAHDVSIFRIDLQVPEGSQCLTFDYAFASEEYPEYVGSNYNDGFLAELDSNDWSVSGNEIVAPGNFAKTSDGKYISVNSTVFANPDTVLDPGQSNTGYDGFSQPLRASTPVTAGSHTLYLSIFDAGDSAYDSAAFIDRLAVSTSECSAGSKLPPTAVDDAASTTAPASVSTNVLLNDTDPQGEALTVTGHTNGSQGTVSCTNSACTYTPRRRRPGHRHLHLHRQQRQRPDRHLGP